MKVKFTCEITCLCGFAATITDPADFVAFETHLDRCPHWKSKESTCKDLALRMMNAIGGGNK